MKLLIVSTTDMYTKILTELDPKEWKIVLPSLYSGAWSASGNAVGVELIKQYLPRFEAVYIEEGIRLESLTLLQHAIKTLAFKEYYLCDFESIDDVKQSIANAYFIDQNHANAKHAEHAINELFVTKVSRAIKWYAIEKRTEIYKQNSKKNNYEELNRITKKWHFQLQNFYTLLPTLASLYWIVKAERNIIAFDPKNIHRIYVQYRKDGAEFTIPFETVYTDEYIQERNDAVEYLRNPNNPHTVNHYQTDVVNVKPYYKPVVLSFLQSKMFYLYHFSIEYTTKIAKRLYHAGLITDPSTSSHYIPLGVSISIIRMLNEKYGEEYVLQSQREYKLSNTDSTAIIPIKFEKEYFPENVENTVEFKMIRFDSPKMKNDALIMYGFICAITEWTQMRDAIYDASVLQIKVGTKLLEAKAHSLVEVFDPISGKNVEQKCWKNIHQHLLHALNASGDNSEEEWPLVLPKCQYLEVLNPTGIDFFVTTPKRPPRFGVGRFNTQILGGKGIGTADSFHIIQNNLIYGGLVTLANNTMMHPNEIAMETVEWCEKFAPSFLSEQTIMEYWDRLERIKIDGELPEQLINEYTFFIDEVLLASGYTESCSPLTEAQIRLAKSIAIKKKFIIDDPDSFFKNAEIVKQFLAMHAQDEVREEDKLFKCPICRQGYVYAKEHVDNESAIISLFYACEHRGCFSIFDNKIDEFFLEKGKDMTVEERLVALTRIASKQHLKNKGYLFTGLKSKKDNTPPYNAKIIINSFDGKNNQKRYGLKILF